MLYARYKWGELPTSERLYYMDMVTTVFRSFGIDVPMVASL